MYITVEERVFNVPSLNVSVGGRGGRKAEGMTGVSSQTS
jgi:hypothetical protein